MHKNKISKDLWFIIAHCFNADGVAASQTITDRLPYLEERGIEYVVLSAVTGIKDQRIPHYQVISPAPSGLRYDMRFIIKNRIKNRALKSVLKNLFSILFLPLYIIEKIFIQLDSQWSWFISASVKGGSIIKKYRPSVLYSTAGPPTTHLAAYILHKIHKIPWMAELHDPLILDDQRPRWHKYYFNRFVERIICNNASVVVYFTNRALENANRRHPIKNKAIVVRPGANPPDFKSVKYRKTGRIHFGHFGSLDKTRNLGMLVRAIYELRISDPTLKDRIVLDLYGSPLDAVSRKALRQYPLGDSLIEHGRLEYDPETDKSGRQQVMEAMKKMDVLVVLHGGEGSVSYEYIPSKLYEYLLTGRPILGLVQSGTELEGFLMENKHVSVDKENVPDVKQAIRAYIDKWESEGLEDRLVDSPFTVEATVEKLVSSVSDIRGIA